MKHTADVHPRKLTWNLKITHLQGKSSSKPPLLCSILIFQGVFGQPKNHQATTEVSLDLLVGSPHKFHPMNQLLQKKKHVQHIPTNPITLSEDEQGVYNHLRNARHLGSMKPFSESEPGSLGYCFPVKSSSHLTVIQAMTQLKIFRRKGNHMCQGLNSLYWGWSSHL